MVKVEHFLPSESGEHLVLVPYRESDGPNPLFVLDLFPHLREIKPRGSVSLLNPFYKLSGESLPDRIKISAWNIGWDRDDLGILREACQPAMNCCREWVRRVQLWGDGIERHSSFSCIMRSRLSALVDISKSFGMVFGDAELVGSNIWPDDPKGFPVSDSASQLFIDLWRLCDDLTRIGYIDLHPKLDRPADTDAVMAERLGYILDTVAAILESVDAEEREATPCEADIVRLLQSVGCRMTTTKILGAMFQRDMRYADSTIKLALARMVSTGRLTRAIYV